MLCFASRTWNEWDKHRMAENLHIIPDPKNGIDFFSFNSESPPPRKRVTAPAETMGDRGRWFQEERDHGTTAVGRASETEKAEQNSHNCRKGRLWGVQNRASAHAGIGGIICHTEKIPKKSSYLKSNPVTFHVSVCLHPEQRLFRADQLVSWTIPLNRSRVSLLPQSSWSELNLVYGCGDWPNESGSIMKSRFIYSGRKSPRTNHTTITSRHGETGEVQIANTLINIRIGEGARDKYLECEPFIGCKISEDTTTSTIHREKPETTFENFALKNSWSKLWSGTNRVIAVHREGSHSRCRPRPSVPRRSPCVQGTIAPPPKYSWGGAGKEL